MASVHYSTTPTSSSYTSSSSATSTHRLVERTASSRLASEYVRTSEELVGYVSYLEGALERVRAESHRFQQESLDARNQAALATHRLTLAHRQAHTLAEDSAQALQSARLCKEQLALTQALLAEEQHKSKVLDFLSALRCPYVKNPYLEADTSKERTASLMRMAQDLLKSEGQALRETSGSFTYSDMKARSLRLECAYVENEIKHLLQPSSSSSQTSSEDRDSTGIHKKTPEFLTARSHFSSEVDKEGRSSSRGALQNGCSPIRSIFKAAQDFFYDVDGLDCMADRNHSEGRELLKEESRHDQDPFKVSTHSCIAARLEMQEMHNQESKTGQGHHKVTVKERCARARFKVPPLDLSGSAKSARFENASTIDKKCGLGQDAHYFQHCGHVVDIREQDEAHFARKRKERDAEREEITQCQTEIMRTLQGLKNNMGYLLDLEERSHLKQFT
ncbi:hypothetical protein L7F22_056115 [Adiantum nelumboides]|nr:hypothetical protein [Adiantum nelumboides]